MTRSHRRRLVVPFLRDPWVPALGALALAMALTAAPRPAATAGVANVDFAAAAARIDPSFVGIVGLATGTPVDRGGGFVLGPGGVVVTAAHVIEGAGRLRVRRAGGEEVAARVVGIDDVADVAVLRIDADPPPVTPAPPGAIRRGEAVAAIGDPLGFAATLTVGHVSSTARAWGEASPYDVVQHDAALNPGSSGGPLIDREGRVVGMNVAIADGARRHVGIGLALPIAVVEKVADRILAEGTPRRPRLGARLRGAEALRPAIPSLPAGVVVEAVVPRSPAAEAGLAAGDLVVAADGVGIADLRDLARVMAAKRVGDPLRLTLRVGEGEATRLVRLGIAPGMPANPTPAEPLALGLRFEAGAGGRIASVEAGSPAEAAGFVAGDEVLSVGARRTAGADGAALVAAAEATAGPGGVALLARRGEETRWLVLGPRGRLDGDAAFGSNAEAHSSHPF